VIPDNEEGKDGGNKNQKDKDNKSGRKKSAGTEAEGDEKKDKPAEEMVTPPAPPTATPETEKTEPKTEPKTERKTEGKPAEEGGSSASTKSSTETVVPPGVPVMEDKQGEQKDDKKIENGENDGKGGRKKSAETEGAANEKKDQAADETIVPAPPLPPGTGSPEDEKKTEKTEPKPDLKTDAKTDAKTEVKPADGRAPPAAILQQPTGTTSGDSEGQDKKTREEKEGAKDESASSAVPSVPSVPVMPAPPGAPVARVAESLPTETEGKKDGKPDEKEKPKDKGKDKKDDKSEAVRPAASIAPIIARPVVGSSAPVVESFSEEEYTVKPGDTYAKISKDKYYSENYGEALRLYNRNDSLLSDGNDDGGLKPGQKVSVPDLRILEKRYSHVLPKVPAATSTEGTSRKPAADFQPGQVPMSVSPTEAKPPQDQAKGQSYTVRRGETMRSIARTVLGNGERWEEIFRLNRSYNPEFELPVGAVLQLPPGSRVPVEPSIP
jgi:hypothetical protein